MHPTLQTHHFAIDARFAASVTRAPTIEDQIQRCRAFVECIRGAAVGVAEGSSFAAVLVTKLQNARMQPRVQRCYC